MSFLAYIKTDSIVERFGENLENLKVVINNYVAMWLFPFQIKEEKGGLHYY